MSELENESGQEIEVFTYEDWKGQARADADSAMAIYNFLDGLDLQGVDILTWNMGGKLNRTKKDCLNIICRAVKDLKC